MTRTACATGFVTLCLSCSICMPGRIEGMRFVKYVFIFTLRHLCGKRGGNGNKVKVLGSIVYWHLSPLARIFNVSTALIHELVKRETSPQQHSCTWQNTSTPVQVHNKTAARHNSSTLVHDKQQRTLTSQNSNTPVHNKTAALLYKTKWLRSFTW